LKKSIFQDSKVFPEINSQNYSEIRDVIGGFQGRDVTGGMATKVQNMVDLCSKKATETVSYRITLLFKRPLFVQFTFEVQMYLKL